MRQIVLLSILQMRKLRLSPSILIEVTEPDLSGGGGHAFNCCAIRALLTVLSPVKLELFIRDECATWPPGACLSQKQLGVG